MKPALGVWFAVSLREDTALLAKELETNQQLLTAIGDEVRLHLIITMLSSAAANGQRVGEIATNANLSRPAVSHHLQILKEAGVVDVRHEGTRNYYFFSGNTKLYEKLANLVRLARKCASHREDH